MESPITSPPNFRRLATFAALDEVVSPTPEPLSDLDYCIKASQKISSERTPEELKIIADILKGFKFLTNSASPTNNNDVAFLELAKIVNYECFSPEEVIFHKGDNNDKIYLVLLGSSIIFNEIVIDVFKAQPVGEEVKEDERSPLSLSPYKVRSLTKSPAGDDSPTKILFQPKMTKKTLRQLTSIGDFTTPQNINYTTNSVGIVPTVHDLQMVMCESYGAGSFEYKSLLHLDAGKYQDPTESPIHSNDQETRKRVILYRLLAKAESERPGKYIKEGQFLFHAKKKVGPGMHFGNMFSNKNKAKPVTAIALDSLHVLTLKSDEYVAIFNNHMENINNGVKFLTPFFPEAKYTHLMHLLDLFEECEFRQRQNIFEENDDVDSFYLIKEGEIQLLKLLEINKSPTKEDKVDSSSIRKKLCIATVGAGEVLGEDDFFFEEKRYYSAIVTSPRALLIKLNKEIYDEINESYKELFESLIKTANTKKDFKRDHVESITQQLVTLAHQKEEVKQRSKMNKLPQIKSIETKELAPKIRGDSPVKIFGSSPSSDIENNEHVSGDRMNKFLEPSLKLFKGESDSPVKLPLLSPKVGDGRENLTKSIISYPRTVLEKQKSDPSRFFTPAGSAEEAEKQYVSKKFKLILHKAPKKRDPNIVPEGSSLYKEAKGHVKRKRPEDLPKTKTGPMSNKDYYHKLYYGELERSVHMLAQNVIKPDTLSEEGYISVGMTPNKGNADQIGNLNWDEILTKNVEVSKILPAANSREMIDLRLENDFLDNLRSGKTKEKSHRSSNIRGQGNNASALLPNIQMSNLSIYQNSHSPPRNERKNKKYDGGRDSSEEPEYSVENRKIPSKKSSMLMIKAKESNDDWIPIHRAGFKPSKVLTFKVTYKNAGNKANNKSVTNQK